MSKTRDDNKKHTGMILDLSKEYDKKINDILEELPSHDHKTNYMKRAILFYHENADKLENRQISNESLEVNQLANALVAITNNLEMMKNEIAQIKNSGTEYVETEELKREKDNVFEINTNTDDNTSEEDYNEFMKDFFGE